MTIKKRQSYSTLTSGQASPDPYHDRDSLPFEASYPLIEFDDDFIHPQADEKQIEKYLSRNFWYQKANSIKRQEMLERVVHVNKNLPIVLDFIQNKYSHLGFDCLHISIAGSFIYSDKPGDIDLDVVLSGSFFDYSFFNEGVDLLDITDSISKVSLTVMGEDNISGKRYISSTIDNQGFVHQDTIIREMLVAPMRNVTVYGKPFNYPKVIDSRNVIARIARQLYFASLTIQGKIPYYNEDPLKTKKALSRINEAHDILEWLFLNSEPRKDDRNS